MICLTTVVVTFLLNGWDVVVSVIFGVVVCATDPLAVDDAVKVSGTPTCRGSL